MSALLVSHAPASAAVVRGRLSSELAGRHVAPASIEDVVLVASELVGNAIRHAPPAAGRGLNVTWTIDDGQVVVSVADGSSRPPRRRNADPADPSGRGIAIVEALAAEWGVQNTSSGKRVWARIPVRSA